MDDIIIKPIGRVISHLEDPSKMPLGGQEAIIEVFPEYEDALLRIEENSHIWVVAWFHKAPRDLLKTKPLKVNPDLPEYGVFALRAFARPNPVAMCLAKLKEVQGNYIYVKGLDAVGGTPVIDIKPYYENDIVSSPQTSYIKGKNRGMRIQLLKKHALVHHQEECLGLILAVKMAAIAEDYMGKLNSNKLFIKVIGSPCLGDCIQGVTRARLANPPRFSFKCSDEFSETVWIKENRRLTIKLKSGFNDQEINTLSDEELFCILEDLK
jgi:tRNA-Thr(GGU) m(6)t(6)A37 methyltransferase TsaA